MSSTMSMWDYAEPLCQPRAIKRGRCARCGGDIQKPKPGKHYYSEACRKRAERARWKAKWKARAVNKYIGA